MIEVDGLRLADRTAPTASMRRPAPARGTGCDDLVWERRGAEVWVHDCRWGAVGRGATPAEAMDALLRRVELARAISVRGGRR